MKKRIAFFGTMLLTLAVGVAIGQIGSADSGSTPGSADDPIVTKSYVDSKLAGGTTPAPGGGGTTPVSGVDTFKVIQLKTGQTLKGGEGTEVIVRSGNASAMASGSGGLSDVTAGGDLAQGETLKVNHLILIPRADGRGIKAEENDPYVMVRGTYTIQ